MTRQVMSHPNPPQVVFAKNKKTGKVKKVGSTELKNHIVKRVSQVLGLMIPEIDCSNDTITIQLRRSGAGRTQGFIVHRYEITEKKYNSKGNLVGFEGKTGHQQKTLIDFNLQKGTMIPTDNENEWLLILTHELIHWVQSKVGAHYCSKVATLHQQEVTHHYNTNNLTVITWRIHEAVGLYSPTWLGLSADGLEFTTGYDTTGRDAHTTSQYYKMLHEKQAHRMSCKIMKEVFKMTPPQAYWLGYAKTVENSHVEKAIKALDKRGWQVVYE